MLIRQNTQEMRRQIDASKEEAKKKRVKYTIQRVKRSEPISESSVMAKAQQYLEQAKIRSQQFLEAGVAEGMEVVLYFEGDYWSVVIKDFGDSLIIFQTKESIFPLDVTRLYLYRSPISSAGFVFVYNSSPLTGGDSL